MLMTTKKRGGGSSDVNSQTALRNSIKLVCIYIYNILSKLSKPYKFATWSFRTMNDDLQAILKLSHNSNTLILEKVWHIAIATT